MSAIQTQASGGWERRLAPDVDPAAVRVVVGLIATGAAPPERVQRTVAAMLDAGADVTVEAVRRALARRDGPAPESDSVGRRLADLGARLRLVGHPDYPSPLADAWPELGAPPWILTRGTCPPGPAVAVVGTRQPTLDGLRTARELGRALVAAGVTVVSGMARGIDQAAHRGALDGGGVTVAVLGAGFDVDYPRGDRGLREEIAASGGLVTELPPRAGPRPRHFRWRNRIVSGLADLTVVVEGGARSGSLQTARLAGGQGRDVWAVPGSLHAPGSAAPLSLVRDGAQVVTRLDDVVTAVLGSAARRGATDPFEPFPAPNQAAGADPDTGSLRGLTGAAGVVRRLLGAVPSTPSALANASGLALPEVSAALSRLEDAGLAVRTPRGVIARPG